MFEGFTDQWAVFLQERWFVIVGAIIVLLIIINLVKTVLKWIIVLGLIAAVFFYGADYIGGLKDLGTEVAATVKAEALKSMAGEAKKATYESSADGTYKIITPNLELQGQAGSNEVEVSFRGQSLGKMKVDETVKTFIESAKMNIN
ncbi:hypothetical protein SY83_00245 [Paenibacillus swuensis]|uniref:Uncharacterized protein n=1 Tax=Paenibacillus swuensis TaxID=1178515 RepID=A0A172TDN2_9BACL|nr:hypothetical protein [Paenibacillus swuensis]ANE45066.1 hypothetical protein SY83_00245 [Paenibacillus swuensis]